MSQWNIIENIVAEIGKYISYALAYLTRKQYMLEKSSGLFLEHISCQASPKNLCSRCSVLQVRFSNFTSF